MIRSRYDGCVSIKTISFGLYPMKLEEFEAQTRDAIDQILNQLQTTTLQMAELERQIAEAGTSVQALSHLIETFIQEQRNASSSEK